MPSVHLIDRIVRTKTWWMVRGESGSLWSTLFQPRKVVAHGWRVPQFPEGLDFESRQRAMLALDEFGRHEVNVFIDEMDEGDVIVTPDAGSGAAWFGLVASGWFADHLERHWIQRRCEWHESLVPLDVPAMRALQRGPMGTVFPLSDKADLLVQCLHSARA